MSDTRNTQPGPARPGVLHRLRRRFWPRRSATEAAALAIPPAGRGAQFFSVTLFFVAGVLVTAFVLLNPFGLGWLPSVSSGDPAPVKRPAGEVQLYQCPMHPEVIEDHPADCPICKMKLTPMKQSGDSATAESVQLYQCPMHPEVIEDHPAECPICKMKLTPMKQTAAKTARGEREVLYWYAPMDPTYVQDGPGTSPMGMALVPRYADERESGGAGVIQIDPVQVQNIGVVSVAARLGNVARTARTVGILDFNADRISWVNVKFSGWIEKVHVNYIGQEVRAGQALFEIYSPELVTTQEEYLRALDYSAALVDTGRPEAKQQAESLLKSTRDRLRYWDVGDEQIRALRDSGTVQRRLTIRAAVSGVVAEIMDQALEGMFVKPGMNLYKIADLSSLWVHADVFESDLPWVRKNQPADVSFGFDPGRTFRGKVLFLYPEVSKETRTLKICIEVPNQGGRLKSGMYADVVLHGPQVTNAVLIPDAAVLRSGERNLVFVDLGQGRFAPRQVELGIRGEGSTVQVVKGLAPGEAVVTQAQFMLDSESRVQEAIAKFLERGTAKPAPATEAPQPRGHNHGG